MSKVEIRYKSEGKDMVLSWTSTGYITKIEMRHAIEKLEREGKRVYQIVKLLSGICPTCGQKRPSEIDITKDILPLPVTLLGLKTNKA